ncbi:FHF complex subunit HOOK interacting protein 2A-like isoform X1 [Carassius carassius]|uniref:FHF complex subunit HOOK interacting protein 2A-like isoform X1 n=1 Tax=Carassius carassius TaxID=217509 RepID=UPI002868EE8F|nr:FHF complex subunit HOOK interacting protein 2A-like isoform X1 [Carassius carassius]
MFSKFTSILQHAVEALAPSLPLQEDFVYHWKAITHYYIETSDDKAPVTDTNIPSHLEQMLDILIQEERERESGETGPCMEYLLHHKILETLYTLGKADCPPGMKQQVLSFYTKLLGRIRQPLLPHINVHRPVQVIRITVLNSLRTLKKLIRLCGEVLAAPTENEEIQFLCTVCAKLKQDPYLINFFLENKTKKLEAAKDGGAGLVKEDPCSPDTGQNQNQNPSLVTSTLEAASCQATSPGEASPSSVHSTLPNNDNYNLVSSLLNLTKSPDGRIVVKACEGLMLIVSLPEPAAAKSLTENTKLSQLLTERLAQFYRALPQSMDPLDIETVESVNWGLDVYNLKEDAAAFAGKRALISFLSWLDYCDQLIKEAQKTAAAVLARAMRERFFFAIMEPQLMQTSEVGILTSTALLNRIIRQVTSEALLQETVYFLLGEETGPETLPGITQHPLRHRLIEHCDHLSDEISIMTLRLFEHLLQKPCQHILQNLVLRCLEERNYMENKQPEERENMENGQPHDAVDLEEDPLFSDLSPDNRISSPDWLSCSPSPSTEHAKPDGKTEVHKIVNSFLCLVPDEAKSSYQVEGTGYDTYLRDAHRQFQDYCGVCQRWNWRSSPKSFEKCNLDSPFFEGHFLKVLFDRMGRILDQPYDVNLQVTSVLSKLSLLPHAHLHEYLLDPYINLAPGCRSLFSVIVRVVGDLMLRIHRIPEFTPKLLLVRKRLLGLEPEGMSVDHVTLLEGVIVLEEFCKELAAIAFVKFHASASTSPDPLAHCA